MPAEPLTEPIYRVCFECGTEWTASALIVAHNAILDTWAPDGIVTCHVDNPEDVYCCPECIHDW